VRRVSRLELRTPATALIAVASCRGANIVGHQIVSAPHAVGCAPGSCGDPRDVVSVTYLGVSGILVEHGSHALLTAPFFSNPSFPVVRPSALQWLRSGPRIRADSTEIERFLPRSADRASVILVGHGHYDHLLDVPYIATHRAKSAVIFGGPSIRHMLMGDPALRSNSSRLVTIPLDAAGDANREGNWFYSADSAFRFMAIVAGHAPNLAIGHWGYLFAEGVVSTDMDSIPRTAGEWKLGEPYAFLIDVLSAYTHRTLFRIYFQDAPSEPPLGFPSAAILAARRMDLAILCAATASNVNAAPDSLLRVLKPAAVMVTHWESFFRSQRLPEAVGIGTDLRQFTRSLRRSLAPQAGWIIPLPHQTVRFKVLDRP
jgi:hypothetical protein